CVPGVGVEHAEANGLLDVEPLDRGLLGVGCYPRKDRAGDDPAPFEIGQSSDRRVLVDGGIVSENYLARGGDGGGCRRLLPFAMALYSFAQAGRSIFAGVDAGLVGVVGDATAGACVTGCQAFSSGVTTRSNRFLAL